MYIVFSEWCYLIGKFPKPSSGKLHPSTLPDSLLHSYIPALVESIYVQDLHFLLLTSGASPLLAASTYDSALSCSSFKQRMNVQSDGWRTAKKYSTGDMVT
jgi:hypothetical protein